MRPKIPDVIDAYIQASNSRDADRFGSLFSEDAIWLAKIRLTCDGDLIDYS